VPIQEAQCFERIAYVEYCEGDEEDGCSRGGDGGHAGTALLQHKARGCCRKSKPEEVRERMEMMRVA
jgi:hypothetical protein